MWRPIFLVQPSAPLIDFHLGPLCTARLKPRRVFSKVRPKRSHPSLALFLGDFFSKIATLLRTVHQFQLAGVSKGQVLLPQL